jgi:hypothetical protein
VLEWSSGGTSFVKSKVTAPFIAKPYFSTDGYVFKGGKIAADARLRRDETGPQVDEVALGGGAGAAARSVPCPPPRSSRRSVLPEAVFGSSSTRWTTCGAL